MPNLLGIIPYAGIDLAVYEVSIFTRGSKLVLCDGYGANLGCCVPDAEKYISPAT